MTPQTQTSVLTVTRNKPWRPTHFVKAKAARTIAEGIVDTMREPLLVLDRSLRLVAASRAFCSTFKFDIGDIIGRPLYELGGGSGTSPNCDYCSAKSYPNEASWRIMKSSMTSGRSDDERCCSTRDKSSTNALPPPQHLSEHRGCHEQAASGTRACRPALAERRAA